MLDLDFDGTAIVDVPAGKMEVLCNAPRRARRGSAIIVHPQPLLGGSATHKIPQLLARALADAGWWVARPNLRGVGQSTGVHDNGIGETDDVLALIGTMSRVDAGARLVLAGFSFGAFVQARVSRALLDRGTPAWRTCLAGLPFGEVASGRNFDTPRGQPDTLVVHGEADDRTTLAAALDWARPTSQPVTVIPGADHFFTGHLPALRRCVLAHLADETASV